jgi:hypothetical protein
MHALSLQFPTYAISYVVHFEAGDEFTVSVAEDGTVHFPPVDAVPLFEDCEGHLPLLPLHLAQQLHPIINTITIL